MKVRDRAVKQMADFLHQPMEKLTDGAILTSLVSDSMILINLVIDIQDELGIRLVHDDLRDVKTVGQLLTVIEGKAAKERPGLRGEQEESHD